MSKLDRITAGLASLLLGRAPCRHARPAEALQPSTGNRSARRISMTSSRAARLRSRPAADGPRNSDPTVRQEEQHHGQRCGDRAARRTDQSELPERIVGRDAQGARTDRRRRPQADRRSDHLDKAVGKNVKITDAQIKAYFDKNHAAFDKPATGHGAPHPGCRSRDRAESRSRPEIRQRLCS